MKKNNISFSSILFTYFSFAILILIGHIRDFFGKYFNPNKYKQFYDQDGIHPIYTLLETFYYRRLFLRVSFSFNNLVATIPKKRMKLCNKFFITKTNTYGFVEDKTRTFLNMGSYDYLGFTKRTPETTQAINELVDKVDFNQAFFPYESGQSNLVRTLEAEMAQFMKRDDCIVFPMGYGTNTWTLSVLFDENTLVLSDQYNHTSIITGIKLSRATVVIYEHNDMHDLESKLFHSITQGHPKTHRTWERVFVVVEGIFSMEGTMPNLKKLLKLKKKYKFYIYMDEAHSCGAVGKTGRGVCEYQKISHRKIDILMGTFSKSFCGSGGYVAGDQNLINYIREKSYGMRCVERMNPIIAFQILESLREIIRDRRRIKMLKKNTTYMRKKLTKLGFFILGEKNSPVIPILISSPGKLGKFYEVCTKMGLAVVIVGYPATPVLGGRIRLCISAAYTKRDLKTAVKIINHAGTICGLKCC